MTDFRNNVQVSLPRAIGEPADAATLRRNRLLRGVFAYIDDNFREPIRLRSVAAAVGHGAAYLTDVVRGSTGRPVHKWIAERRVAEARRLLATTEAPVARVARDVGFRDPAYFSRAFVRAAGQSPSQWRRIHGGRPADAPLDALAVAATYQAVVQARETFAAAATRAQRDAALLAAASALVPNVTVNRREPSTGTWYRYDETAVAFRDVDASIPLLLHGCTSAELDLERSYFDFYRRLSQVRSLSGFFKLPLFTAGVCTGALCAIVRNPADITLERRFALEELARAYSS